jgi:hypothetical protein
MNVVRGDHIVEHGQTEAFFCLENPVQITAPITHSDISRYSRDVIFINGLNGAQRLNDWNVLNKFLGNSGE